MSLSKIKIANTIAVVHSLGVFGVFFMLIKVDIPPSNKDIFNSLASSVLPLSVAGVMYYVFGYKKKSEE